jgi:multiple sugar transport system substrate-binding protein
MEFNQQRRTLWQDGMKLKLHVSALAAVTAALGAGLAWTLQEAAKPYAGTELEVLFLDRPGHNAAIQMLPEFEAAMGYQDDAGQGQH